MAPCDDVGRVAVRAPFNVEDEDEGRDVRSGDSGATGCGAGLPFECAAGDGVKRPVLDKDVRDEDDEGRCAKYPSSSRDDCPRRSGSEYASLSSGSVW